jgi:hypothetical protein
MHHARISALDADDGGSSGTEAVVALILILVSVVPVYIASRIAGPGSAAMRCTARGRAGS